MHPIDEYFLNQEEPVKSCLAFLRSYIRKFDSRITEDWKYGMPFYCINGKMCCYLWVHKVHQQPYLGVVEGAKVHHPNLTQHKRARMKILLINPAQDIPMNDIDDVLKQVVVLY